MKETHNLNLPLLNQPGSNEKIEIGPNIIIMHVKEN